MSKREEVEASKTPADENQINCDTLTLDEGRVVLRWPAKMSHDSYGDFKDWLVLIMRQVERRLP